MYKQPNNEELHSLYRLPSIVRVIKSRILRWGWLVVRVEEGRSAFKMLTGKTALGRPTRRWEDNIRIDLKERYIFLDCCTVRSNTINYSQSLQWQRSSVIHSTRSSRHYNRRLIIPCNYYTIQAGSALELKGTLNQINMFALVTQLTYFMAQQPLKSLDRYLMSVSIIVTLIFYQRQSDG